MDEMKLLRVCLEKGEFSLETLPPDWQPIGGSALLARIMNKEVPPQADPLGPENAFIVAAGPLAGRVPPSSGVYPWGPRAP